MKPTLRRAVGLAIVVVTVIACYIFYSTHLQTKVASDVLGESGSAARKFIWTLLNDNVNKNNRPLDKEEEEEKFFSTDNPNHHANLAEMRPLYPQRIRLVKKNNVETQPIRELIGDDDNVNDYKTNQAEDEFQRQQFERFGNIDNSINEVHIRGSHQQAFPENNRNVLDAVESFNGEIKGNFNGIIVRVEDRDGRPSSLKLVPNGIIPQRRPIDFKQDAVADTAAKETAGDGPAGQPRNPLSKEDNDNNVNEKGRANYNVLGDAVQDTNHNLPLPVRRADEGYSNEENRNEPNSMRSPGSIAAADESKNVVDNPTTRSSGLRINNRVFRTELIGESDDENNDADNGQAVDGNDPNDDKELPFGNKIENEMDKIINRNGDGLLRERFDRMKGDLERLQEGEEPEIELDDQQLVKDVEGVQAVPVPDSPRNLLSTVDVYDLTKPAKGNFLCALLTLRMISRTVCVNREAEITDPANLIATNSWEEEELDQFRAALANPSDLGVIDIGAGLGVFTLVAADKQVPVVAVEPLLTNIQALHKTLQLNQLIQNVTLVTDALGASRSRGKIQPLGSKGGALIERLPLNDLRPAGTDNIVRIVTLDDVISLVASKFSHIVMKIDVGGDENQVFKGARRFFAQLDVRLVIMRWMPSQNRQQYQEAQTFLRQYNLQPARSATGSNVYSDKDLNRDIKFIVWRKIEFN